ncbi:hypothetical protein TNIN_29261 [Trichonephila inaurata madagascariensis]|uniref:Uncharacterized protein n=1 Tax=Trichonephila inaurata madagascariensis TaxID=2747483 RepID=A0A8X6IXN9_9ARAC|nr:hypothetical protein TNIN_29261 [Trichonephila inaurata madagascariensis]
MALLVLTFLQAKMLEFSPSTMKLKCGIKQLPHKKSAGPDGILKGVHLGKESMKNPPINDIQTAVVPNMWRKGAYSQNW